MNGWLEKVVVALMVTTFAAGTAKVVWLSERQAGVIARLDSMEKTIERIDKSLKISLPAIDRVNEQTQDILEILQGQRETLP